MKRIIILIGMILFLWPCAAQSWNVLTFAWDVNSETDLKGYRLYQAAISGAHSYGDGEQIATILAGTETVTLLFGGNGIQYWVLTAENMLGNQSGPSNEISFDIYGTTVGDDIDLGDKTIIQNFETDVDGNINNQITLKKGKIEGNVVVSHPYWIIEDVTIKGALNVSGNNVIMKRLIIR